jgi:predicted MFS family arabinose efflux permease
VFLLYLAGTASSALAGTMSDSWGRRRVLVGAMSVMAVGLALSVPDIVPTVLIGIFVFTAGFFAAHSVASAWVSARATEHRAEASSLYLLAYYLGSSIVGALGGVAFATGGWIGLFCYVAAFLAAGGVLVAVLLRTTSGGGKPRNT